MSVLEYLEVKVIESCNYRCSGCAGWGNIAKREIYDLEQYESDVRRVSELFDNVKMFHILGGEPLLNECITDYISIARRYMRDTEIYLITNGTLLGTKGADFYQCIRENNVKVHISHYPVEKDLEKIKDACARLEAENVNYEIIETDIFSVSMLLEDNKYDIKDTFNACSNYMNCTNLYNGMIYKCPRPISLRHYDRKFGTHYSDMTDGIDIYNPAVTGQLIIERLDRPIRTCRLCTPERKFLKWSQKELDQFQWQICKENKLLIDNVKNHKELMDIAKRHKLMVFVIDHVSKKVQRKEYTIDDVEEILSDDVYIWLNDLKCLAYCNILKYLIELKNGHIKGLIAKNEKISNAAWGFSRLDKGSIKDISRLIVLSSGIKGFFEVEYEINKILNGEKR